MNVFIARSTVIEMTQLEGHTQTLRALLVAAGHKVEILNLPPIAASGRTLTNLASYRLIESASSADVLICLDAVSAILPHPRKLVLLLDDRHLDAADTYAGGGEPLSERQFLANVLRTSLEEAADIFVLSRFAAARLGEMAVECACVLPPACPAAPFDYSREPGSELLVLNPLNSHQRPELLIDCLAALPEPLRARWIAPHANSSELSRVNALALEAGVEQRLAIDVRQINEGEKAYALARAAALLELAPAILAAGHDMHHALQTGVPVIACSDGGALAEDANQDLLLSAKPDGLSLAAAVRAALGSSANRTSSAPAAVTAVSAEINWAPLMKAVVR